MKVKSESEVAQSCPTLFVPMDRSLLGSSIHGIFQARVLEWVAIAFSVGLTGWMLICISLGTSFALNIWSVIFVEGREWVNREGRWAQGDGQGGWSKVALQYSAPVRWFCWVTAMWRSAREKQEVKFKDQLGGFRRCSAKRGWDCAKLGWKRDMLIFFQKFFNARMICLVKESACVFEGRWGAWTACIS